MIRLRVLGLLLLAVAGLLLPAAAHAHGAEDELLPLLEEAPAGPYSVTVRGDLRPGSAGFDVFATAEGRPLDASSQVVIELRPRDRPAEIVRYPARFEEDHFTTEVTLSPATSWDLRLLLNGPAGPAESQMVIQSYATRVGEPAPLLAGLTLLPLLLLLLTVALLRRAGIPVIERSPA